MIPTGASRPPKIGADDEERRKRKMHNCWYGYLRDRGVRYGGCRLDNFECSHPGQSDAVQRVRNFSQNVNENLNAGVGLLLFGPVGTGKDHLLTASVHESIRSGFGTGEQVWNFKALSGPELFGRLRAAISGNRKECDVVSELTSATFLCLSDICQSGSTLTAYQREVLYRVIDSRYSNCRPTWLTANASNRDGLDAMLGNAITDRLIHNSVVVPCDWPSYRKVASK